MKLFHKHSLFLILLYSHIHFQSSMTRARDREEQMEEEERKKKRRVQKKRREGTEGKVSQHRLLHWEQSGKGCGCCSDVRSLPTARSGPSDLPTSRQTACTSKKANGNTNHHQRHGNDMATDWFLLAPTVNLYAHALYAHTWICMLILTRAKMCHISQLGPH